MHGSCFSELGEFAIMNICYQDCTLHHHVATIFIVHLHHVLLELHIACILLCLPDALCIRTAHHIMMWLTRFIVHHASCATRTAHCMRSYVATIFIMHQDCTLHYKWLCHTLSHHGTTSY